jgi:hypothetical protein
MRYVIKKTFTKQDLLGSEGSAKAQTPGKLVEMGVRVLVCKHVFSGSRRGGRRVVSFPIDLDLAWIAQRPIIRPHSMPKRKK